MSTRRADDLQLEADLRRWEEERRKTVEESRRKAAENARKEAAEVASEVKRKEPAQEELRWAEEVKEAHGWADGAAGRSARTRQIGNMNPPEARMQFHLELPVGRFGAESNGIILGDIAAEAEREAERDFEAAVDLVLAADWRNLRPGERGRMESRLLALAWALLCPEAEWPSLKSDGFGPSRAAILERLRKDGRIDSLESSARRLLGVEPLDREEEESSGSLELQIIANLHPTGRALVKRLVDAPEGVCYSYAELTKGFQIEPDSARKCYGDDLKRLGMKQAPQKKGWYFPSKVKLLVRAALDACERPV